MIVDYFMFPDRCNTHTPLSALCVANKMPSSPTCFKNMHELVVENKEKLPPKIADLKFLLEALVAQTVIF